ncbi:hypothetical protein [Flavobacterium sp. XS2P14]|uniref:hypothetical protein n=1 Tax=Flavobacterium sp. XS2P14 TaxID=3401735 RepID=UPI003AAB8F80
MKIFKLKIFAMITMTALLWSCQTEQIVADEVTSSKKKPLPDGIPSDGDDVYEFAKSRYTHNGKVITDTLQIINMLSSASGLHIDETGNNKQIFVTDQELQSFENTTEKNTAYRTAVLDGDNYLHYFFEVSKQDGTYKTLFYFSIVGPRIYGNVGGFGIHTYTKVGTNAPELAGFVSDASYSLSAYMYNQGSTSESRYTDINVKNTTRYNRRVKFISEDGRTVTRDLSSRTHTVFRAGSTSTSKTFAGLSNFKIKRHESIKL